MKQTTRTLRNPVRDNFHHVSGIRPGSSLTPGMEERREIAPMSGKASDVRIGQEKPTQEQSHWRGNFLYIGFILAGFPVDFLPFSGQNGVSRHYRLGGDHQA